jgi:hypothetical protein
MFSWWHWLHVLHPIILPVASFISFLAQQHPLTAAPEQFVHQFSAHNHVTVETLYENDGSVCAFQCSHWDHRKASFDVWTWDQMMSYHSMDLMTLNSI